MQYSETRQFVIINAHEIHGGLGFRYNDDLGRKCSLVGHCLVFVFGWAYRGSNGVGLILALTVCDVSS